MAKRVTNLPVSVAKRINDRKNYSNESYDASTASSRGWISGTVKGTSKTPEGLSSNLPNGMGKNKKNISWWIWVLAIIVSLIIFGVISERQQKTQYEDKMKQEVIDINYCRSKAAEYGKQGDAIFSKVYNDCLDAKGW